MAVDPLRHLSVFSPVEFGSRRVDIIGVGATGSAVGLSLAKLGVENQHFWDPDRVAIHNIANQAYGIDHEGDRKVDALADLCETATGIRPSVHAEAVTAETGIIGDVVFLLTDSMQSRREIAQGIFYNGTTGLLVETRMDADMGYVYSFNPNSPSQIEGWTKTLYDDEITVENACGAVSTVGATAQIVAGLAVWQLLSWFRSISDGEAEMNNEIIVTLRPMMIQTRSFSL